MTQLGAVLTRTGKRVLVGALSPREIDVKDFDENFVTFAMPPFDAAMKNLPSPGAKVLYFFDTPDAQQHYIENNLHKGRYHPMPLQQRLAFTNRLDPFTKFWRTVPPTMIGVMEYVVVPDDAPTENEHIRNADGSESIRFGVDKSWLGVIYIDMMSVRRDWRSNGLNMVMAKSLLAAHPGKKLAFSPVTEDGLAFVRAAVRAGLPIEIPKQMDGGRPIDPNTLTPTKRIGA